MTFLAVVACQVGTAFAARTERRPLREVGFATNPLLLWGIAFELLFFSALIVVTPIAEPLGMRFLRGRLSCSSFPSLHRLGRRRAAAAACPS